MLAQSSATEEIQMTPSTPTSTRELHTRAGDGIKVRLLWCEDDARLWVTVVDFKKGGEFCVDVRERARALDVFHHPYAYAAHYGIETVSVAGRTDAEAALSV